MSDKNFIKDLNTKYININSPYIYYNYYNEPELIFCNLINSNWQLNYYNINENKASNINTGINYQSQLDPAVYIENNKLNLIYLDANLSCHYKLNTENNFITNLTIILDSNIYAITNNFKYIFEDNVIRIINKNTNAVIKKFNLKERI